MVVQPVDLFPHTNHYMTVLLLVRVAQVHYPANSNSSRLLLKARNEV